MDEPVGFLKRAMLPFAILAGAISGVLMGLLADNTVLHPSTALETPGRWSPWLIAPLFGIGIALILLRQGRIAMAYERTVLIRSLIAYAGWPMLCLAWLQPHLPTSLLLMFCALLLLAAGYAGLHGLARRSARADACSGTLSAAALLTFCLYLQGEHRLEIVRGDTGLDGTWTTTRWAGLVETRREAVSGITDVVRRVEVEALRDERGYSWVLLSGTRPLRLYGDSSWGYTIIAQLRHQLATFRNSTRPSLTLKETIPFFRWPWTLAAIGLLLLAAFRWDPVALENQAGCDRNVTWLVRLSKACVWAGLIIGALGIAKTQLG